MNKIPFSEDAFVMDSPPNIVWRAEKLIEFMGKISPTTKVLNVGGKDFVAEKIRAHFGLQHIDYTLRTDFNEAIQAPSESYDFIFCFEVLEHIMNPAKFLSRMGELLASDGIIHLSTPLASRLWGYNKQWHFVEYSPETLLILFDYCGYKVVRRDTFLCARLGAEKHWWGIRPMLRHWTLRTQVYELAKKTVAEG